MDFWLNAFSLGALCIYHLNSFRLYALYPYLSSLKKKHQLKESAKRKGYIHKEEVQKTLNDRLQANLQADKGIGPPILKINKSRTKAPKTPILALLSPS